MVGIYYVETDVAFKNFGNQAVQSAPARHHHVQRFGTIRFLIEEPFQGINLSPNASNALKQLLFISSSMGHDISLAIQDTGVGYPVKPPFI